MSRKPEPLVKVVGATSDGKQVVSGAFALVDTHGIPLELVLERFEEAGLMPDWLAFYDDAVAAGWKPSGVVTKLTEAVGDVHGPEFREGWDARFRAILAVRDV